MKTTAREEMAWAAGLFDGEGHVRRGIGTDFQLVVTQVDRRVLDRFAAAIGFGHIYGPYQRRAGGSPISRYQTSGHPNVQAACAMLWQWLSPVKREQFRAAFASVVARPHRRHVAPCEHGLLYPIRQCKPCRRAYHRGYYKARWKARRQYLRLVRKTAVAMLAA